MLGLVLRTGDRRRTALIASSWDLSFGPQLHSFGQIAKQYNSCSVAVDRHSHEKDTQILHQEKMWINKWCFKLEGAMLDLLVYLSSFGKANLQARLVWHLHEAWSAQMIFLDALETFPGVKLARASLARVKEGVLADYFHFEPWKDT